MTRSGWCLTLRAGPLSKENDLTLSAILEPPERVPEKYYISEKALRGLMMHTHGQAADNLTDMKLVRVATFNRGGRGQRVYDADGLACTLTSGNGIDGGANARTGLYQIATMHGGISGRVYSANGKAATLTSSGGGGYRKTGLYQVAHIGKNRMAERVCDPSGKSRTITSLGGGQGSKTGLYTVSIASQARSGGRKRRIGKPGDPSYTAIADRPLQVETNYRIRRLMPVECERLQGFPRRLVNQG